MYEGMMAGPTKDAMAEKQKDLACGAGTYFLSVGLTISALIEWCMHKDGSAEK